MTKFRWHSYIGSLMFLLLLAACAGHGHGGSAVDPASTGLSGADSSHSGGVESRRYLFGLWDVSLNRETGQFEAVPLRSAGSHVNVVGMMQSGTNLGIEIVYKNPGTGEFHIDVTLTHPVPNSKLRGFDVRGIMFGNMSSKDDPDLLSSKDDPDLLWMGPNGFRLLNPDGWTRWWNPKEFTTPGLFGYTQGIFGSKGFVCPATLNPYKYFANCLSATDPVVPKVNSTNRGTFATDEGPATRRYELVFPLLDNGFPDATFQYAIDASWAPPTGGGDAPGIDYFPISANCPEAFHISVDSSESELFYKDENASWGELALNIEVFDWGTGSAGIGEEVEEIRLSCPPGGLFDDDYISVVDGPYPGSTDKSGIWKVSVPDVHPSGLSDQPVLVTVVPKGDLTYEPPVPGSQYPVGEKLAAYKILAVPVTPFLPTDMDADELRVYFAVNITEQNYPSDFWCPIYTYVYSTLDLKSDSEIYQWAMEFESSGYDVPNGPPPEEPCVPEPPMLEFPQGLVTVSVLYNNPAGYTPDMLAFYYIGQTVDYTVSVLSQADSIGEANAPWGYTGPAALKSEMRDESGDLMQGDPTYNWSGVIPQGYSDYDDDYPIDSANIAGVKVTTIKIKATVALGMLEITMIDGVMAMWVVM